MLYILYGVFYPMLEQYNKYNSTHNVSVFDKIIYFLIVLRQSEISNNS